LSKVTDSVLDFYNKAIGNKEDDIYSLKTRLKIYLLIIGLLILSASSIYTYSLVEKLKAQELAQMEIYRQAQEVVGRGSLENEKYVIPDDMRNFVFNLPASIKDIPIIVTDYGYTVQDGKNISGLSTEGLPTKDDSILLAETLNSWLAKGRKPIQMKDEYGMIVNKVYFDDSNSLKLLKYYPFFQFALIAFFIGFGYLIFSSTRESEQNQVWVGMAKETAHQLGTPIAAIMGWIEHLRMTHEGDEMTQEIVTELDNDVNRLSLVADRFSKIGSAPELVDVNMYEEIEGCRDYMQRRAPRKVKFDFPVLETPPSRNDRNFVPQQYLGAKLNKHLFDWVVENLLRNALDAMEDGEGTITAKIYEEPNWVCVDITDTGKGIPKANFKTVFQPGFTTKKRGWGLGLSLAKRIIENYHGGKILVKDSELGKFTTFTIKLPKAEKIIQKDKND
jgi:Histidine kinase-, DNA gyrase B-, and HSP90-like ATPase